MKRRDDLTAWAAGLYDGEGSASMYTPRQRTTPRRQMQVSQAGVVGVRPEALVRFLSVVGEGNITGPYRGYLFYWKTTRKDGIDAVASLLWPYLSDQKRQQFASMTLAAGRDLPGMPVERRAAVTEAAWAAGFFDGEGCITLSGSGSRVGIQLELPQASADRVPETLVRFHAIVGRGSVHGPYAPRSPWSRLPQYRWTAGGRHQVSSVLRLLWPWLGAVKRSRVSAVSAYLDPGFDLSLDGEPAAPSSSM